MSSICGFGANAQSAKLVVPGLLLVRVQASRRTTTSERTACKRCGAPTAIPASCRFSLCSICRPRLRLLLRSPRTTTRSRLCEVGWHATRAYTQSLRTALRPSARCRTSPRDPSRPSATTRTHSAVHHRHPPVWYRPRPLHFFLNNVYNNIDYLYYLEGCAR